MSARRLIRKAAARYDDGSGEAAQLTEEALADIYRRAAAGARRCRSCGTLKLAGAFGVDVRRPDGLDTRCRACDAARKG